MANGQAVSLGDFLGRLGAEPTVGGQGASNATYAMYMFAYLVLSLSALEIAAWITGWAIEPCPVLQPPRGRAQQELTHHDDTRLCENGMNARVYLVHRDMVGGTWQSNEI